MLVMYEQSPLKTKRSCRFTHDSLFQTLQILFSLLMALVQESDSERENIR